jgi:hypothetical protein
MKTLPYLLVLSLVLLAGCATNGYTDSYRSYGASAPTATGGSVRVVTVPMISREVVLKWMSDGWVPIGDSRFIGEAASQDKVLEQAQKVGAQLVLISSVHVDTVTGTTPMTSYQPYSTYSTDTRGRTFTQTGWYPYTEYRSYTVDRYDQAAVYMVRRQQPMAFGAIVDELSPSDRQQLGTNRGVRVATVVHDTPAWKANVLPGDDILAINSKDVANGAQLEQNAGTSGQVEILRNGQLLKLPY